MWEAIETILDIIGEGGPVLLIIILITFVILIAIVT